MHKCCRENGAHRLARCRVVTNLPFVSNARSAKHNKEQHTKTRYAFAFFLIDYDLSPPPDGSPVGVRMWCVHSLLTSTSPEQSFPCGGYSVSTCWMNECWRTPLPHPRGAILASQEEVTGERGSPVVSAHLTRTQDTCVLPLTWPSSTLHPHPHPTPHFLSSFGLEWDPT